jgi:hypothetical protein
VANPTNTDVSTALSVEQTWHNLMKRRAVWLPERIKDGATFLHGVDLVTGLKSK